MILNTIGLIITTIIYGFYGFMDNKINDLKIAFFG